MMKRVIKPRKRNRRHREPFRVRAGRVFKGVGKVLAIVLPLPAIGYCGWWVYGQATASEYLSIKGIAVSGVERVAREDVVELSGIKEGQNILSFSEDAVIANLKANPWIESAEVGRNFPDTVEIIVRERAPVVLVKLEALYLMDSQGVIFKRYSAEEDSLDLPVVTGLSPQNLGNRERDLEARLLELISVLTNRRGFNITRVSEISIDPNHGLSLFTLEEGVRLDVGTGEFEEKLASFEKILETRDGVLRGIEAFDLTNHREVIVKFTTDIVKRGGEADGQKG